MMWVSPAASPGMRRESWAISVWPTSMGKDTTGTPSGVEKA